MTMIHSVDILWEDLLGAFSSNESDKAHYLDRITGQIITVSAAADGSIVRQQLNENRERFLQIPSFDYQYERQIIAGYSARTVDPELKRLLNSFLSGNKAFARIEDILEFYPLEDELFALHRDQYLSDRMKLWMDENNLYTASGIRQLTSQTGDN